MNKVEVLSPVGSIENFNIAIRSGCDAVYLGLPRFNARMRADNITLEDLSDLVRTAHLKGVKVYITLNTLLTISEITEVISMVEECLRVGVDAFIVQDLGLVSVLKSVFPNITLHASTQLGVHNVRGARVAKNLGFDRVVLSRECTLEDIRSIKSEVDIEIEYFVQGAMCVAFSGNCYLSSIKHNASGNRGECKQLCRLPFELSSKSKTISGYPLSPRDNCMLPYLHKLIDAGVDSLKIEGRLRNTSYLSTATSTYARAVEALSNKEYNSLEEDVSTLKSVFSRGDFIAGYIDGNDVINVHQNNHLGDCIGSVISSTRFKDMFKITLSLTRPIVSGDGLKFGIDSDLTMGVGNIEFVDNKYIVYGKNNIPAGSKVYLTYDSSKSSCNNDMSKYRVLDINIACRIGKSIEAEISCDNYSVRVLGDVVLDAMKKPLTAEVITSQMSKVDSSIYKIDSINIDLDEGAFLPLSSINELRRRLIAQLEDKICNKQSISQGGLPPINSPQANYSQLSIVDEGYKISNISTPLILSPTIYSLDTIMQFEMSYHARTSLPLYISLPIIAMSDDLRVIDNIVTSLKDNNCIFVANNIYALDYICDGVRVVAGFGMNITNDYSSSYLLGLGAIEVFSSIEKWSPTIRGSYKFADGNIVLMTFAHCPHKTLSHNDCSNCKYVGDLSLRGTPGNFTIRRYKIVNCYHELVDGVKTTSKYTNIIRDLR